MSKYHNKVTYVDGIKFDSQRESEYYVIFREAQKRGEIVNLRMQVKYELIPAIYETYVKHLKTKDKIAQRCVQKAVNYLADFVYEDSDTGIQHVVDIKGGQATATKDFKLKQKMLRYFHNINIEILH